MGCPALRDSAADPPGARLRLLQAFLSMDMLGGTGKSAPVQLTAWACPRQEGGQAQKLAGSREAQAQVPQQGGQGQQS